MEFKTTIGFFVNYLNDGNDAVDKLNKLKDYLIERFDHYHFKGLHQGVELKDKNDLELALTNFLNYVETYMVYDYKEDCYTLNPRDYHGNSIDLEDGEIEFESSFIIHEDGENIFIYLNTEDWYSSELERLPFGNIGISCEMNDIDGDWYEFEI